MSYENLFEQNKNLIAKEITENFDRFIEDLLVKRIKPIEARLNMDLKTKMDYKDVINFLSQKADKYSLNELARNLNEFQNEFQNYCSIHTNDFFDNLFHTKIQKEMLQKADTSAFVTLENKLKNYVVFTKPNTEVL